jgi:alpha-tubulin suppressor-like RCC1 family protein
VDLPGFVIDVDVGPNTICAILRDGSLHCWGSILLSGASEGDACADGVCSKAPFSLTEELASVAELSDYVVRVAVGDAHACAVGADGVATCWGSNQYGRLGITGVADEAQEDSVEAWPSVLSRLINVTDIAVGAR